MPNGHQRYFCLQCKQTFSENFGPFYYYRRINPQQIQQVLQAHSKGTSLRGISRITGLAYNTAVSIVRSVSLAENEVDYIKSFVKVLSAIACECNSK